MSAHHTGEPAPQLIARVTGENRMTLGDTDVIVGAAELITLSDALTKAGADVRVVEREPNGECAWCINEPVGQAEVTVYGDPADNDPSEPLTEAETCRACALTALEQALIEQSPTSGKPIAVEIGVSR